MSTADPVTEFDGAFSDPGTVATPWAEAEEVLGTARIFWLSTVRTDGRPHVTPLLAAGDGGALHFCTGPDEQKAVNLRSNRQVVLTTGSNDHDAGLDVVVEGLAERVDDRARLEQLTEVWVRRFGPDWQFRVAHDGTTGGFASGVEQHAMALVFAVRPDKVLSFTRGVAVQTRYRFPRRAPTGGAG